MFNNIKKIIKKFFNLEKTNTIIFEDKLKTFKNELNNEFFNENSKDKKIQKLLEDLSINNIKNFNEINIDEIINNFERDLKEISRKKDLSELNFILIMDDHYGSLKLLENDLINFLQEKKNIFIF